MSATQRIQTTPRACDVAGMTTDELRAAFMIEQVMNREKVQFTFTDLDRMAVAGAEPGTRPLELTNDPETGRGFFLERRELGILNTGGAGTVVADGTKYDLATHDCLYVGMGTRSVTFASVDAAKPAKFFMISTPAHQAYPTTKAAKKDANPVPLGSLATANQRTIYQYIHEKGIKSCQLVMGFTEFQEGSVWNTMPPHTHSRRTEIYFYFDLGQNIVVHLMGEPQNTRNLIITEGQAVLSPQWSIHSGCGTGAYRFIWAMGGENQRFDDMDKVVPTEMK
ncbi:MAG TPA: 5-dehydro-4-deoxy-D-glucuronate isomerase [Tepidisphaeraceae bacterium]|nr:5-dehydro-4-deoxy-D-glucuronate isomerase [Tepidisphaeraceae bacterium]